MNSKRIFFERWVLAQWASVGPLALLLWPLTILTWLYLIGNKFLYKLALRRSYRTSVPVIVVGNVVVGGAGKTPVVIALAKYFTATSRRVGIISRGYGRQIDKSLSTDCMEVLDSSSSQLVGDEPKLIYQKTNVPVFVGSERAIAAKSLLEKYPGVELIISDDGLQNAGLERDIELVLFDQKTIGNALLLPAGPLREPWPRGSFRVSPAAHEIILSPFADNLPKPTKTSHPKAQVFNVRRSLTNYALNGRGDRLELLPPPSRPVHALAGIAQPEQFFQMLQEKGLNISQTTVLEDHATLDAQRLKTLGYCDCNLTPPSAEQPLFLCTEKDAVKIWEFDTSIWAVPLECELAQALLDKVDDLLIGLR
jgi:tetraacyldisaccharide 4'-kinase